MSLSLLIKASALAFFFTPSFLSAGTCAISVSIHDDVTAHKTKCITGSTFSLSTDKIEIQIKILKNGATASVQPSNIIFFNGNNFAPFSIFSGEIKLSIYDINEDSFVDGGYNDPIGSVALTYREN